MPTGDTVMTVPPVTPPPKAGAPTTTAGAGAEKGAIVKPTTAAAKKSANVGFLAVDPVAFDRLAHPEVDLAKREKIMNIIMAEAVIIAGLVLILVLGQPFFKPLYRYAGLNDKKELFPMVPLPMPNLTNKAVLAWATTSVTEVMTFGFADVDAKILAQRARFTSNGWDGFVHAFLDKKVGEKFMQNRLVLTTVPTDVATIKSQGPRPEDGAYQWVVQLPVVMTYATNDSKKTQEKTGIELTIVRTEENIMGIAIDSWTVAQIDK